MNKSTRAAFIQGFTLLEVLVALAILAIALAAVIKTTTENVENTRYLRDRTLAHWVAMNVLTEIQVRGEWPSLGKKEGTAMMAEREWFWIVKASETVDEELRRLDVQVYYHREDKEPVALLVGFVGAP
ncbi:MAG TPA: type II secretion system protein GspI [Thioploca sp.]|nr:MAG: type II secretion system protein GspI [Gammaproteobacteria bacterium]HDN27542.1 type II secretion system protein GspI [Thioploca sp.]